MNCVQSCQKILKGRAQFIEQRRPAGKDRVTTKLGMLHHTQHSVGRRVSLKRVVRVKVRAIIVISSNVTDIR